MGKRKRKTNKTKVAKAKATVEQHHRTWMTPEEYAVYREAQAKQVSPSPKVVHPPAHGIKRDQLDQWPEQWWRTVSYKRCRCAECGSAIPPQQTFACMYPATLLCQLCAENAGVWKLASDSRRLKAKMTR